MKLLKKTIASIALVTLVSSLFTTGAFAYSEAEKTAADSLAAKGIIVAKADAAGYNLDQNVLRQEIAAVARGVAEVAKKTTCAGSFKDVTATTPNDWACYSIEALLDAGLIAKNDTFRPEANITKAEAVGMMVKAAYGTEYAFNPALGTTWQEQVVAFAVEKGIIASFTNYEALATRGFVFEVGASSISGEGDDLSDLMDDLLGEDDEDDTTSTGTTDDTVVSGNGELTVTLSADTPDAQNIPQNAKNVEYLAFDVTAGSEDVTITSVKLKRVDLGSRNDFGKVWLSQDGVVISNDKTIASDDTVTITLNHTIKAGTTEKISVNASMNATGTKINAFELVDIEASADLNAEANIRGNSMTTVNYSVARVTVEPKGSNSSIDAGEELETIGEFKLSETQSLSKKDVIVNSIRFKASGGVDLSENLENLALYEGSTKISTDSIIDGDYVTFKLDELVIADGKSLTLNIKADITSGNDGDTIAFQVKDDFDIFAMEEGTSISADIVKGTALATYTLNAGKVTISRDTSTPSTTETVKDSSDILAFVAKVDTDQAVLVDSLKLFLDSASVLGGGLTTKAQLDSEVENVKVYVNDTLVDSVDTITEVTAGNVFDGLSYYDFDSSFELKDNDLIKVYFTLTSTAATGTKIRFKLDTATSLNDVEYVSDGESVAVAKLTGNATSNNVEVVASSAGTSIVRNDGFSSETFLAGEQGAVLKKFVINAGNSSSLEVRKMRFDATITGVGNTYSQFTNFKLLQNGSQVGGTEDLNGSNYVTIDDINVTIAKGAQTTFLLVADIDTSVVAGTIKLDLDGSNANGDSVYYDLNDNEITFADEAGADTSVLKDNAILAVSIDGDTADSAIVLGDTTGVEIAKYKFTATDGDVNIKDLYFKNIPTGADARVTAYKLVVNGSVVDSRVPSSDVVHFDLGSTNKIVVPKNDDIVVSVKADFNKITNDSQTNKTIKLELTDMKADTAATAKALTVVNGAVAIDNGDHYTSSALAASDIQSETMYIRKTQPTIATQDVGTTKLVNGEQTIYKFTVSADSKAAVDVAAINFNVVTGGPVGMTIGSYKLFINGTDKTADLVGGAFVGTKATFAADKNAVIAAGTSKTFELKATLGTVVSDNYVSVKIVEDAAAAAATDKATAVATAATFVWSDNSGSPHTDATLDYFNGNNVNGLDTNTTTLTN